MGPGAPSDGALALPRLVAGRYELRTLLGSGGMGDVYGGVDVLLHRGVAVKLLRRAEHGSDPDDVGRFHAEACALAAVASPHVVAVHDFGFAEEGLYAVMPLLRGRPLDALLAERGALPVRRAVRLAAQMLGGLRALHAAGLVHGDVKPNNVLVERGVRAVLVDLGVAADLRAGRQVGGGTPPYMAPEVARGAVDERADLFAAGIVLVEMLVGEAMEDLDDCVRCVAALPSPLAGVARTAIEPEAGRRFRDARSMRDALRAALAAAVAAGLDPATRLGASASPPRGDGATPSTPSTPPTPVAAPHPQARPAAASVTTRRTR